ncbi:MAG TPA: hypothetical protein VMU48_17825 [Terracidiphilus sp.]|nr:hypothetical protein [Terracidiphilus sp.]
MPALPSTLHLRFLRHNRAAALFGGAAFLVLPLFAQTPPAAAPSVVPASAAPADPIAIVPLGGSGPGSAAEVTGALQVMGGKAFIVANGTVTSGSVTTDVTLPHRGTLRVCASTTVKLAADTSVPAGDTPGLMMALDHGAVEASFATGRNADILLTPDFRILISGPGAADVKVRLGEHGDTCVDNPGANAPYVLVTSVFDNSDYRVQPGQRVMFQHGNLHEVVDNEKEPCGCPPAPAAAQANEFPLAQSEGLAPLPTPAPAPAHAAAKNPQLTEPLVYKSADRAPLAVAVAPPAPPVGSAATQPIASPAPKKKPGFFGRIGRFFRRIFGAE